MRPLSLLALAGLLLPACAPSSPEELSEMGGTEDVGVGSVEEGASPGWGHATKCKPIPLVDPLLDPEITISLDGLTLHLRDKASDYDRVFPIGPGQIDDGESLTPPSDDEAGGVYWTGSNTTESADGTWGYYYPCRMWWTDPDSGKKSPVFAGLPFIRLAGPPTAGYGIHGPIDNYKIESGGTLRRGYVSHGCVRMSAEDIVEVYGRIHQHPKTPVRVQKEVEMLASGEAVDVEDRWIGSECSADDDCNYDGGFCRVPESGGRGTCTRTCVKSCPDRAGEASTFCVSDPADGEGICVPKATTTFNNRCDRHEGRLDLAVGVPRPDKSAKADVCLPPP